MTPLIASLNRHPIIWFLLITFTYTWSVWFAVILLPDDWGIRKIATGIGFGPAVAAIALSVARGNLIFKLSRRWFVGFTSVFALLLASYLSMLVTGDAISADKFADTKPPGLTSIGIVLSIVSASVGAFIAATAFSHNKPVYKSFLSWRSPLFYLVLAAILPSLWLAAGAAITSLNGDDLPSVVSSLEQMSWLLYSLRSVLFTFFVVAIGEELGWRGWLLPSLQEKMSPLIASVVLGIIWGLWHFPLFLNGGYDEPPQMVFAKVGVCVFLSILFTWFYNRSGGNVLTAILLHTALNSSQRFIPPTEFMGIFMLLTIVALTIIDKMWRRR